VSDREAYGYAYGARPRRRRIAARHCRDGGDGHEMVGAKAMKESESQRRREQYHGLDDNSWAWGLGIRAH
jgi:hypothetical protein